MNTRMSIFTVSVGILTAALVACGGSTDVGPAGTGGDGGAAPGQPCTATSEDCPDAEGVGAFCAVGACTSEHPELCPIDGTCQEKRPAGETCLVGSNWCQNGETCAAKGGDAFGTCVE